MDLNKGARDVEFARGLCQMLNNKNNGMAISQQVAQAAIFLGRSPDHAEVGDTPGHPAAIRFDGNGATIFVILGARTVEQSVQLCNGYLTGPTERNPGGFNPYARLCGQNLLDALVIGHASVGNRLIFAAHSWGGPTAMAMAAALAQGGATRTVSICTFGSPMAGDGRVGQAMRGFDLYRWMSRGDHVPFLPPSPAQAPAVARLLAPNYSRWQSEFHQFGLASELEEGGAVRDQMYPSGQYVFTDLSLVAFAASNDAPIATAHSLQTYLERIDQLWHTLPESVPASNAVNAIGGTQPAAPSPPGATPPPPIPGMPVPELISNRPPVPAGEPLPYQYFKLNGQNVVMFHDAVMCVCTSRRAARDMAHSLNLCWKRWYRTRIGDNAALTASVSAAFPS